jgi:hypothetical protein
MVNECNSDFATASAPFLDSEAEEHVASFNYKGDQGEGDGQSDATYEALSHCAVGEYSPVPIPSFVPSPKGDVLSSRLAIHVPHESLNVHPREHIEERGNAKQND